MHAHVTTAPVKPPSVVTMDTSVLSAKTRSRGPVATFQCTAMTASALLIELHISLSARSPSSRTASAMSQFRPDPHSVDLA